MTRLNLEDQESQREKRSKHSTTNHEIPEPGDEAWDDDELHQPSCFFFQLLLHTMCPGRQRWGGGRRREQKYLPSSWDVPVLATNKELRCLSWVSVEAPLIVSPGWRLVLAAKIRPVQKLLASCHLFLCAFRGQSRHCEKDVNNFVRWRFFILLCLPCSLISLVTRIST